MEMIKKLKYELEETLMAKKMDKLKVKMILGTKRFTCSNTKSNKLKNLGKPKGHLVE